MEVVLYIIFGVVVAGFIGGMTNYLAIKMLFHPRHPIVFKGKKLPFTPGLIPKRKSEISRSLGRIVSEHLVTSKGLLSVVQSPNFKRTVEDKMTSVIDRYCLSEQSVKEELLQIFTEQQLERGRNVFQQMSKQSLESVCDWLWQRYEIGTKQVEDWLQYVPEARMEQWKQKAASVILQAFREHLLSFQGERLIGQAVEHFIGKQTGFFGALAGAMVDTQKLTWRIQDALGDVFASPQTEQQIMKLINDKLQQIQGKRIDELVHAWTGSFPLDWLKQALGKLDTGEWFDTVLNQPMAKLFGEFQTPLHEKVPFASDWVLKKIEDELDRFLKVFDLPGLVEREVNNFPVERLEQLILTISGKELRAITWLGAILGGAIGLIQSIFYLFVLG